MLGQIPSISILNHDDAAAIILAVDLPKVRCDAIGGASGEWGLGIGIGEGKGDTTLV